MPAVRGILGDGAGIAASALRVRFLIDNALPPLLAELLVNAGQDAVHVRTYNMQAASDDAILARALAEDFNAMTQTRVAPQKNLITRSKG